MYNQQQQQQSIHKSVIFSPVKQTISADNVMPITTTGQPIKKSIFTNVNYDYGATGQRSESPLRFSAEGTTSLRAGGDMALGGDRAGSSVNRTGGDRGAYGQQIAGNRISPPLRAGGDVRAGEDRGMYGQQMIGDRVRSGEDRAAYGQQMVGDRINPTLRDGGDFRAGEDRGAYGQQMIGDRISSPLREGQNMGLSHLSASSTSNSGHKIFNNPMYQANNYEDDNVYVYGSTNSPKNRQNHAVNVRASSNNAFGGLEATKQVSDFAATATKKEFQKSYLVLGNIDEVPLLQRQDNLQFEGAERYSSNADYQAALVKRAEYIQELLQNEAIVLRNSQNILRSFQGQRNAVSQRINLLEADLIRSQDTDEVLNPISQLQKVEDLSKEVAKSKGLIQDSQKLEEYFKRSYSRTTRRNIDNLDFEITSLQDKVSRESNMLAASLASIREYRKDGPNSAQYEQRINQLARDVNGHREVYLESWNRTNNVMINLSENYYQQSQELSTMTKKYTDAFDYTTYQSEIRGMEQQKQKIAQINSSLKDTSLSLGSIFRPIENPAVGYFQIKKNDDYKKTISDSQKSLGNMKQGVKSLKFAVKSYRDPTNAKHLSFQRLRFKISDALSEDVKKTDYKLENVQAVCNVLGEIEKEEQKFKDTYQSDKKDCQVRVMDRAEKLFSDAEKGKIDDIERSVDACCGKFNYLIADYIQIKNRLNGHLANPEVQNSLGSLLRSFIAKVELQLNKCSAWNEKIYRLRYLGSPIEGLLDELNVDAFQNEYYQFVNEVARDYINIELFIKYQEPREKLQSSGRRKSERLRDYGSKQIHEKTADKIRKLTSSLKVIDENLSLLDECFTAAIKVKATVDYLISIANRDLEQGGMRGHLKDERDHLAQTAKLVQHVQTKTTKEYEVTRKVLEWYVPQFLSTCHIYDLLLKYFYKEGSSVFGSQQNKSEVISSFQIFSNNYNNLVRHLSEQYIQTHFNQCLGLWKVNVETKFSVKIPS